MLTGLTNTHISLRDHQTGVLVRQGNNTSFSVEEEVLREDEPIHTKSSLLGKNTEQVLLVFISFLRSQYAES